jgi:hypothetical protein
MKGHLSNFEKLVKVKLIPNIPETLVVGYVNAVGVRDLETFNFAVCLYELLVRYSCLSVCLPGGLPQQNV